MNNAALKNWPRRAVRVVPIPPELVDILRQHIARYGSRRTVGCSVASGSAVSLVLPLAVAPSSYARPDTRPGRVTAGPTAIRPATRRCLAAA